MKSTRILSSVVFAAALLSASAANAELYKFTVSGDYSATWQLDSDEAPAAVFLGQSFRYDGVNGLFSGSHEGTADLYFRNGSRRGGLFIVDYPRNVALMLSYGPQLYSGSEDNFEFKAGTFELTDTWFGTERYTLTISAVPEPATYGMMLAGLGLVGIALRRRHVNV